MFKYEYCLIQQTPMLHFQHDQTGATLRASEVKPKLDRFIIERCGGDEAMRKDAEMKKWFLSDKHLALNYKMSIRARGEARKSTEAEDQSSYVLKNGRIDNSKRSVRFTISNSYFGNMVQFKHDMDDQQKSDLVKRSFKDTVFYPQGLTLTIICFIPSLLIAINEYIIPFFLLNNFGTRSNKGFGSFTVSSVNGDRIQYDLEEELKKACPFPVFRVNSQNINQNIGRLKKANNLLENANELYKLMKSGINYGGCYFRSYLFQYMHRAQNPIGNEKAWIKKKGIAPVVGRNENISRHEHDKFTKPEQEFRYVRAVLGVGDTLKFTNNCKVEIKPNENSGLPQGARFRFASPIVFKIFDGVLYILPFPVNEKMFNKEFDFTRTPKPYNPDEPQSVSLKTPDSFDMIDFISNFAKYINDDCNPRMYNNNTNKKLSKANAIRFRGTIEEVK